MSSESPGACRQNPALRTRRNPTSRRLVRSRHSLYLLTESLALKYTMAPTPEFEDYLWMGEELAAVDAQAAHDAQAAWIADMEEIAAEMEADSDEGET